MNLAIDIGNTLTKAGIYENDELLNLYVYKHLDEDILEDLLEENNIKKSILSTVRRPDEEITHTLLKYTEHLAFNHKVKLPFKNNYDTPETLGLDRLAAVAGGNNLYPETSLLIIDAGTCITMDYLSQNQGYMGGRIMPGIEMRFKALHNFTDQLPLIQKFEHQYAEKIFGTDTESSIKSGVLEGVVNEMQSAVNQFVGIDEKLKILLTGGNSDYFASYFKNEIFAIPNLVLTGLNAILNYNVNNSA